MCYKQENVYDTRKSGYKSSREREFDMIQKGYLKEYGDQTVETELDLISIRKKCGE